MDFVRWNFAKRTLWINFLIPSRTPPSLAGNPTHKVTCEHVLIEVCKFWKLHFANELFTIIYTVNCTFPLRYWYKGHGQNVHCGGAGAAKYNAQHVNVYTCTKSSTSHLTTGQLASPQSTQRAYARVLCVCPSLCLSTFSNLPNRGIRVSAATAQKCSKNY